MMSLAKTEPSILQISNTLGIRYQQYGYGPPLVMLHTIRTQLEYFRSFSAAAR